MIRERYAVLLRLCAIELVITTLWVFASCATSIAAKFDCTPQCANHHMMSMPPTPPSSPLLGGSSMPMMGCPPTVPIEQALATGFAAAAAAGLAFNAHDRSGSLLDDKLRHATHSGAHFNPAISFSLALRGRLPLLRLPFYILAQLLGAMLGAALSVAVAGSVECLKKVQEMPATISRGGEVLLQTVFVCFLSLVYHWAQCRHGAMATPIFIGFCYIMAMLPGFSLLRGHVLNPARPFGLAVVGAEDWRWTWCLWVGSICGAIVGAGLDALLFAEQLWDRFVDAEHVKVDPQVNPGSGSGESACCGAVTQVGSSSANGLSREQLLRSRNVTTSENECCDEGL